MNPVHYLVYLFPIATLLALFAFFYWYWGTQRAPLAKRLITPPEEAPREQPRFTFAGRCHPLVRRDAIPILLITAVYAPERLGLRQRGVGHLLPARGGAGVPAVVLPQPGHR